MPATLTAVAAGLGAIAGDGEVPAEVFAAVEETLASTSLEATSAFASAGVVAILGCHRRGEDAPEVHAQLWEALRAGGEVARQRGLHLAARDLLADVLPSDGLLADAGPAVAELTFEPRAAESVVVLLAPGASVGSLNGALYRAFADPLNTAGLVRSPAMQAGFAFEVHDLRERRKAVFQTPAEAYALLGHLDDSSRYVLKRIVSGGTGALVAAVSTESSGQLVGTPVAGDSPLAVVRCQGEFPTLGEVLEPFATPLMAGAVGATGRIGPLVPTAIAAPRVRDLAAAPVIAAGFQVGDTIEGPRDLFADAAFDEARRRAAVIAETLQASHATESSTTDRVEAPGPSAGALIDRWTPLT
jgi:fructose 1,6-bisphosphate aldolase/phosphatase